MFPYCADRFGSVNQWSIAMTQIDLSPVATTVSDAASAEHSARDKWARAGKALAKLGIVSGMLVRSTEKNPNELFNQSVYDQIRGFIVQGLSASKKGMVFQTTVPGSISAETPKGSTKWTVADLLNLSTPALRDIDDDVLKEQRRKYMQEVDGPYISRIRQYIDRANGVEKKREPKTKQEEQTTTDDPIVYIQGLMAKATKIVDVADVDRFREAGLEMIALMRRIRKTA
jgi:hypothetical protein